MPNGILKLSKTAKGKVIVALDRLNGRPPMPLSFISLPDMKYEDKACEYGFENGRVTYIKVEGEQIYPFAAKKEIPIQRGFDQPNKASLPSNVFADSFNISSTFLPKDIRSLHIPDIDNFNLKFNKAPRYIDGGRTAKFYFFKNDYRKNREGIESGHKFLIKPNFGNLSIFIQVNKRLETQSNMYGYTEKLEFHPDWRLIVGLGSASLYEVGMSLHHVYGIPYIPSSSIKGLVRSWIIQNCFGAERKSEAIAFQESKLLCDIFGSGEKTDYKVFVNTNGEEVEEDYVERLPSGKIVKPELVTKNMPTFYKKNEKKYDISEKEGEVIFFDAYPSSIPKLEPDIMNVHFPDYYNDKEGKVAPTDFQNPNPIVFLTVGNKNSEGRDMVFQTYIAARNYNKLSELDPDFEKVTKDTTLTGNSTILEFVKTWLMKALSEHGIGAKTAVGYGYMNESNINQTS